MSLNVLANPSFQLRSILMPHTTWHLPIKQRMPETHQVQPQGLFPKPSYSKSSRQIPYTQERSKHPSSLQAITGTLQANIIKSRQINTKGHLPTNSNGILVSGQKLCTSFKQQHPHFHTLYLYKVISCFLKAAFPMIINKNKDLEQITSLPLSSYDISLKKTQFPLS